MNVVIVEDEQLAVERLEQLLKDIYPTIQVLSSIDTVKEAAVFLSSHVDSIDLVFLDIQLADGKSFEIFTKINFNKPVIFTTAYDQFAIQAFKLNSIDYLLKPVLYDELQAAINKFKEIKSQKVNALPIDQQVIIDLLNGQNSYKKRFLVKMGTRIQYRNADEVALFTAEDKICHLVTTDNKKYLIDHTLEVLENDLLDPKLFFRISRQAIVNINAIKEARTEYNRMEILLNISLGHNLVVSRSRVKEFKDWLNG